MKLDILKTLNTERAARRAVVVVTDVASGEQRLVKQGDIGRDPLADLLDKHIRSGKSGMEDTPQGTGLSHRPRAAAAPDHHRRGAYQPGAGASRQAAWL